jgi:hypothetical protein
MLFTFRVPPGKRLIIDLGVPVPASEVITLLNMEDDPNVVEGKIAIEGSQDGISFTTTTDLDGVRKNYRKSTVIPYGTAGTLYRYVFFQCPIAKAAGDAQGPFAITIVSSLDIRKYSVVDAA